MIYRCTVCGYEYDEAAEGKSWNSLPDDWICPVCGVGKELFEKTQTEESLIKPEAAREQQTADTSESSCIASESAPETAPLNATSSDICAETMANWGVKWVLGMVGHSNLGMADAIRRQVENGKMRYIGIRHEGAAAFACSAYGKLSGNPAACISIAGPGSTNLLTGLCDAALDSAPAIALTGQVPSSIEGLKIFQDINLRDALHAATPAQFEMYKGGKFGRLAARVCSEAIDRKCAAQLIMPDDVQVLPASPDDVATRPLKSVARAAETFSENSLREAADIIANAQFPVILMGRGCRGSAHKVEELAEMLGCPIMTTYPAKGIIPDSHPLSCGVQGLSGTAVAANLWRAPIAWLLLERDLAGIPPCPPGKSRSNRLGLKRNRAEISCRSRNHRRRFGGCSGAIRLLKRFFQIKRFAQRYRA